MEIEKNLKNSLNSFSHLSEEEDNQNFDYLQKLLFYKEKFQNCKKRDITGHKKRVYTLDWLNHNNSNTLITGSADTTIKIWDINNINDYLLEIKGNNDSITNLSSNPESSFIFLSTSADKYIKLWDIRMNLLNNNNSNIKSFHSEKTKYGIKHIIFNNSGTQFAYSSRDGNSLFIYDLLNFKQIKQIDFKTQINEFEFNKTDTKLFITDDDGHINILNTSNYDEINMIEGHFFQINCINISKSNKNFITGGYDSLIVMYDMNELMSLKVFKRSEQSIKKCQFSQDEKFIASIYEGTNVDFFSVELGCPIFTIYTDNSEYCIKWNNKNNILAYCGDDKNNHEGEDGNVHLIDILY